MKNKLNHRQLINKVFNQEKETLLYDVNAVSVGDRDFLLMNNYGYLYDLEDLKRFDEEIKLLRFAIQKHRDWMAKQGGDIAEEFNSQKRELMDLEAMGKAKKEKLNPKLSKTFIYLMHNPINGLYKIGRSLNPVQREVTLASQEPEIITIHTFRGTNYHETALHNRFFEKRVRGEWFRLEPEEISFIQSLTDNCEL